MARSDRLLTLGEAAGKSLRIASIDPGGSTIDLAITQYVLDDCVGNNIKINPRLLFREGFKVASDYILLDVIQLFILPAIQQAIEDAGVAAPTVVTDKLFGNTGPAWMYFQRCASRPHCKFYAHRACFARSI